MSSLERNDFLWQLPLCAALTPDGLCSPRNPPGHRYISRQLTETWSTIKPIPQKCRHASVHDVSGTDPALRHHGWLHKMSGLLLNSEFQGKMAALPWGLFPSLFHLFSCIFNSVSSFFHRLCSPSQWEGNIARMKFHAFPCTTKTEALDDRAEGEGESTEILGIKSVPTHKGEKCHCLPGHSTLC